MTPDYLDLLLGAVTRDVPLAEPRIAVSTVGASPAEPGWTEIETELLAPRSSTNRAVDAAPELGLASDNTTRTTPIQSRSAFPPGEVRVEREVERIRETASEAVLAPTKAAPPHSPGVEPPKTVREAPPPEIAAHETLPAPIRSDPARTERWLPTRPIAQQANVRPRSLEAAAPVKRDLEPQPISIRIDRIEVRAGKAAAPPAAPKPATGPRLNLEDYLTRGKGSKR